MKYQDSKDVGATTISGATIKRGTNKVSPHNDNMQTDRRMAERRRLRAETSLRGRKSILRSYDYAVTAVALCKCPVCNRVRNTENTFVIIP